MTEDKLVSVIIAVYNVENYLTRCIDSIRNQTYKNLEIILIDDGSTDQSALLCDCFSIIDSRIFVIHKENGGLSSARNAGLEMATGEYIYFLDSDDYIEPQLLEKTISVMEKTESEWCGFGAIRENIHNQKLYQISFKEGIFQMKTEEEKLSFFLSLFLNYLVGWEVCFHIYRRDIIKKNRLQFVDERMIYAEDLLFSFCYLLHIEKIIILSDSLYHYIERDNSLMWNNKKSDHFPQIQNLLEVMYQMICITNNILIKKNFHLIYLSLLEWHAREYIVQYGIDEIKKRLMSLSWKKYISKNYFNFAYQEDIKRYGVQCGVISVVIPLIEEHKESVEKFIKNILQQSIQRLDIMILCSKGCYIENRDFRIRYIYIDDIDYDIIFQYGFKKGYGDICTFLPI